MTDDDKKRLTEWLGECWHPPLWPLDNGYCPVCGKGAIWRDFTTWDDFGACFNRLVELGEWEGFCRWLVISDECGTLVFRDHYLFNHREIKWLLSRTESGHYRLCVLVGEWLTAQKEGLK